MSTQNSILEIPENLDFSFDQLDGLRLEGLEDLKNFHRVKRSTLVREQERLTARLGADNQRVAKLSQKISYTDGMVSDLDVMITEARIKEESQDADTWRVHGKVIDKSHQGIKGVTLALYNEKGKWEKQIDFGCTDENGYFYIDYLPEKDNNGINAVSPDKPLFLQVSDKEYQVLYRHKQPLYVSPGQVENIPPIMLPTGDDGVILPCTPPEPGKEEPVRPLDQWIVKGWVSDEQGSPITGVTVRLYDKEHKFDQMLGAQQAGKEGEFQFTIEGKIFKDHLDKLPLIYLTVADENNKTLYSSRKAIRYSAGRTEAFDIKVKKSRK